METYQTAEDLNSQSPHNTPSVSSCQNQNLLPTLVTRESGHQHLCLRFRCVMLVLQHHMYSLKILQPVDYSGAVRFLFNSTSPHHHVDLDLQPSNRTDTNTGVTSYSASLLQGTNMNFQRIQTVNNKDHFIDMLLDVLWDIYNTQDIKVNVFPFTHLANTNTIFLGRFFSQFTSFTTTCINYCSKNITASSCSIVLYLLSIKQN